MPILQSGPFPSNAGPNNYATATGPAGILNTGLANTPNSLANLNNYAPNAYTNNGIMATNKPSINTNFLPNNFAAGNVLANEITPNMFPNKGIVNEQINNNALPATITSANFVPIANVPTEVLNNLPMTPVISEIVPSLQYGDITMSGDLPIGGTIKVCGCFPVYGMINVDGNVPSTGTAVVAETFGNNLSEVVTQYANQVIM